MLAWPSFAMLKASLPDCHITALVPKYTAALAELCPWIDAVIIDPGQQADKAQHKQLVQTVKAQQFDASINLFSTMYNALLVWKARIPYRLAPATNWRRFSISTALSKSARNRPNRNMNTTSIWYALFA